MKQYVSYFEDEAILYSDFWTFKVTNNSSCNTKPTTNNLFSK